MSTIEQIVEQLKACNFEHVRAVVEPDDVMVLLDHLEKSAPAEQSAAEVVAEESAPEPKKKASKK